MGKTHEALERATKEFEDKWEKSHGGLEDLSSGNISRRHQTLPTLEGYTEIKSKLATRFENGTMKIIAVTSSSANSGTSTTAIHLALSLAADESIKVLLVDANFRSPQVHRAFGVTPSAGLADLLCNDATELDLMRSDTRANLYILPAGLAAESRISQFESVRFDFLLQLVRKEFAVVVIDTPNINAFSESKVIARKSDGVLMVVESGKTRQQVALRAKHELERAGATIIGVILNRRKHYIPTWLYNRL